MLKVVKSKLLFEFWSKSEACRELLKEPTQEAVMTIIKDQVESVEGDFHAVSLQVWVGSNGWQGYVFDRTTLHDWDDDDKLPDPNDLNGYDANVVGDAGPWDTLWIVFEDEEWHFIERDTGINLDHLRKKWPEWLKAFEGNKHPDWVTRYFEDDKNTLGYEDIMGANIEIKLR